LTNGGISLQIDGMSKSHQIRLTPEALATIRKIQKQSTYGKPTIPAIANCLIVEGGKTLIQKP
jgi:hypothetical protein